MINTTRLRRRISKYCDVNGGGKAQTGESAIETGASVPIKTIQRLRNGCELREPTLAKIDGFLAARGY